MIRFSLVVIAVLASGCKDKKEEGAKPSETGKPSDTAKPAAKPKLVELDASAAGEAYKGWKLMAPEGATAKEAFGALEVKAGDGFQLEVHSGALDMPARKKETEANDVNKLKRYVSDTPDAIVYESEVMGKTEFHFLAAQKIGGEDFSCENTKGPTYSQVQIETMLESCKSIHK